MPLRHLDIMDRDELWELLPVYFAGHCSDEEVAAINWWIATDAEVRYRIERERLLWQVAGRLVDPMPQVDSLAALERIRKDVARPDRSSSVSAADDSLDQAGGQAVQPPPSARGRWQSLHGRDAFTGRYSLLGRGFAVVAAALCLALGIYKRAMLASLLTPESNTSSRVFSTTSGQVARVVLDDGTIATLAPSTTMRVRLTRAKGARSVWLDGEALFEVVHDRSRPFVVQTASAELRDVGTVFDARCFADERSTSIFVASGEVQVRPTDTHVYRASDRAWRNVGRDSVADLSAAGGVDIHLSSRPSDWTSWTSGRLTFDSATLAVALPRLGHWFGLDFSVSDPRLLRRTITGTFSEEPVADALKELTAALGLRASLRNRHVVLSNR